VDSSPESDPRRARRPSQPYVDDGDLTEEEPDAEPDAGDADRTVLAIPAPRAESVPIELSTNREIAARRLSSLSGAATGEVELPTEGALPALSSLPPGEDPQVVAGDGDRTIMNREEMSRAMAALAALQKPPPPEPPREPPRAASRRAKNPSGPSRVERVEPEPEILSPPPPTPVPSASQQLVVPVPSGSTPILAPPPSMPMAPPAPPTSNYATGDLAPPLPPPGAQAISSTRAFVIAAALLGLAVILIGVVVIVPRLKGSARPAKTTTIKVISNPGNALVLINRALQPNRTPMEATVVADQSYDVQIEADGFQPFHVENLRPTAVSPAEVRAELVPIRAVLVVRPNPPEARVTVAGIERGPGEVRVEGLPLGREIEIKIELDGYKPFETRLTPSLTDLAPMVIATLERDPHWRGRRVH
jgi:hypothetical protein